MMWRSVDTWLIQDKPWIHHVVILIETSFQLGDHNILISVINGKIDQILPLDAHEHLAWSNGLRFEGMGKHLKHWFQQWKT